MLVSGDFENTLRLWALGEVDLCHLDLEQIRADQIHLLQQRIQEEEVTETERKWLTFILELIQWRQRFDIEIGETIRGVPHELFDIEIA